MASFFCAFNRSASFLPQRLHFDPVGLRLTRAGLLFETRRTFPAVELFVRSRGCVATLNGRRGDGEVATGANVRRDAGVAAAIVSARHATETGYELPAQRDPGDNPQPRIRTGNWCLPHARESGVAACGTGPGLFAAGRREARAGGQPSRAARPSGAPVGRLHRRRRWVLLRPRKGCVEPRLRLACESLTPPILYSWRRAASGNSPISTLPP